MRLRKISNPNEIIEIIYEDKGDIKPCYDKNGELYDGYTSFFKWVKDGKEIAEYNCVPHKKSGNMHKIRFASDKAFLATQDIDLDSYEELNDIQR